MLNSNPYNPDVLTCLANLSSDEVFTPPKLANEILDQLPEELWSDPDAKFLDPFCKSGVFLREIAKRLLTGLEAKIPDQQDRINHIFKNQLYGIAITELTALLCRRSVYCSKTANGEYSVCDQFDDVAGNIRFERVEHTWENGKCIYCGTNKEGKLGRGEEYEGHAYQFIHTEKPEEIFNMKFDVIVGNPPYQLETGGSGRQAKPLYNLFVEQAKKLQPSYLSMVIPSRWFAGGMGLDQFRTSMLNDGSMRHITDYPDARECFPSVDIAGGVCYFLWAKEYEGSCEFRSIYKGKEHVSSRVLNEFPTLIRHEAAVSILRKACALNRAPITGIISSTRPYGLKTSDRPTNRGELFMISSKARGKISKSRVTAGSELIDGWKVMTSKTSHDHAGQPDKDGMRKVLSRTEVIGPNTVCTESYIVFGKFKTEDEANNCMTYMKTKLFRFLVSLLSFSQDITRERFKYVPLVSFDSKWDDDRCYSEFNLSSEEIEFVESKIRPME